MAFSVLWKMVLRPVKRLSSEALLTSMPARQMVMPASAGWAAMTGSAAEARTPSTAATVILYRFFISCLLVMKGVGQPD
jgi:hypothetical protein